MEWVWNAMLARIGWALGEAVMVVSILIALVLAFVAWAIWSDWKQKRCRHEKWDMTGPGQSEKRCRECDKLLIR